MMGKKKALSNIETSSIGAFLGVCVWIVLAAGFVLKHGIEKLQLVLLTIWANVSDQVLLAISYFLVPVIIFAVVGYVLGSVYQKKENLTVQSYIYVALSMVVILITINEFVIRILFGEPIRFFGRKTDVWILIAISLALAILLKNLVKNRN